MSFIEDDRIEIIKIDDWRVKIKLRTVILCIYSCEKLHIVILRIFICLILEFNGCLMIAHQIWFHNVCLSCVVRTVDVALSACRTSQRTRTTKTTRYDDAEFQNFQMPLMRWSWLSIVGLKQVRTMLFNQVTETSEDTWIDTFTHT